MRRIQACLAMACLALASCRGAETTAGGGGGATAGGGATTGDEDVIPSARGWATMEHGDRMGWMGQNVRPRMARMFGEFDSERYADFSCATCHGEGASSRGFAMPSHSLPALHATGTPEQQQMVSQYGEMVRFMFQRVLPTMQTLVGGADYDEETQEGYSCYSCHPHAGDEGSTPLSLDMPEAAGDDAGEAEAGDAG